MIEPTDHDRHKWPSELIVVRHGLTFTNLRKQLANEARERGETPESAWAFTHERDMDTQLTDMGHKQARNLGRYLGKKYPAENRRIDHIIHSPYLRTRQTTEGILSQLGYRPELVAEERIREIEFGLMDGLNREGVRLKYPDEAARRDRDGKYWYRPPGGESRPDVRQRVGLFFDALNRDYVGYRVLVVCHSVVVLAIRSLIERWGEDQYMKTDMEDDVKNCGITSYERVNNRKLVLREYNIEAPDEERIVLVDPDPTKILGGKAPSYDPTRILG